MDVYASDQSALSWSMTPLTSLDLVFASLSILAQVVAICFGSVRTLAFSISSLSEGTFSCDQLELFCWRMFFPLNVGSRNVCGLPKSFSQPTFGQIATFALGTLQNFVYIASCVT